MILTGIRVVAEAKIAKVIVQVRKCILCSWSHRMQLLYKHTCGHAGGAALHVCAQEAGYR